MTIIDLRPTHRDGLADEVLARRLHAVEDLASRQVAKIVGAPTDAETQAAITAAVESFVACHGRPRPAARRVSEQFRALGASLVRSRTSAGDVDAAFARLGAAVMPALNTIVGTGLVGDQMVELRQRVREYLRALCLHTVAGMTAEERRRSRARDHGRAVSGREPQAVSTDGVGRVRVLVAVHGELPPEIRLDPSVLPRESTFEVLVPEGVSIEDLCAPLWSQVVYGPLTTWAELPDALALVWRAAAIMRERHDDRLLVPCEELVGDVLVNGNEVLKGLLIRKHLGPLARMSASRRGDLAETLLHWLERGLPVNQLARELGLPPQTMHSRIKTLRDLLGDRLDDPTQRLELIVALRSVVPRWRRTPA